jgi:hypothetical protein
MKTTLNFTAALLLMSSVSLEAPIAAAELALRPPAVPLIAHDPYFSIWSPANRLTDAGTTHWTGKPHPLRSLLRVDGKSYRLMGTEPGDLPALPQIAVEVLPTRTIYRFSNAEVAVTLTFLTPALPADLDVLTRPVTYLDWNVRAADTRPHSVQVYFDCGPEIAVNEPGQQVVCDVPAVAGLKVLRAGSWQQRVLGRRGDDLRVDWGHLYLAASEAQRPRAALVAGSEARQGFVATGLLPAAVKGLQPPVRADKAPALAMAFDLGEVGPAAANRHVLVAYDDLYSIQYASRRLRPYWRRGGMEMPALLQAAAADYPRLAERCRTFDEQLAAALRETGGEKYAALCALAYRQTWAGNKIAADANGMPLVFPKENFSNGCISTVDVLFPQAPFFLVFSPALTKGMLVPILDYASSPEWPYGYAPHDLGTYPFATGQVYGMEGGDGGRMPVEESGNMLIILAALSRIEGNADLTRKYWPLLTRWADYLVANGLDPENQLCSADMFGHLPHCANLALKAIIGIGGYAQLCQQLGKPGDAQRYMAIARRYAARWQALAGDAGRTRLAYHLPGTWGMKHNLIWDRVLGLDLFPASIGDAEVAWYLKVQKKYGLPVDSRTPTSLIDWALWSIAPARNSKDFEALVAPLFRYADETPNRVPLSDWFTTTDARQRGFQARPVVGGIFIRMLADPPTWNTWAGRAAKVAGPWTPPPRFRKADIIEVAPTAQKQPVLWRYTLAKPAENWFQAGFDDSAWKQGPAGFGTVGTPGAVVRTKWDGNDIWLRREFTLGPNKLRNPQLLAHCDEDGTVYINGVLAAELPGYTTAYERFEIAAEALSGLRPGKNLMAVHCQQTTGGQYIDVGLIEAVGE